MYSDSKLNHLPPTLCVNDLKSIYMYVSGRSKYTIDQ